MMSFARLTSLFELTVFATAAVSRTRLTAAFSPNNIAVPSAQGVQASSTGTTFYRRGTKSSSASRIGSIFAMSGVTSSSEDSDRYTIPDQPARFARAKDENNQRYLDISTVYDPAFIKGKRVAVTGANRGVGLALATELKAQGAKIVGIVRSSSPELEELQPDELVKGIDQTDDASVEALAGMITGGPIDILINNAGYFYEPEEKIDCLNFAEQIKMVDICAMGPLRISSSLFNAGLLKKESVIIMITSQGGSVSWRTTQNPDGGDYGHHMSKCAANMMSALLSQEMKKNGIAVGILHPGFNKTGMTAKYKEIWEIEGAVDASVGAKRVIHEIGKVNMETSGKFVNCEDGLEIPW